MVNYFSFLWFEHFVGRNISLFSLSLLLEMEIDEIVPGVYLSDAINARKYEDLKALGIQQILTIGSELREHGTADFKTLYVRLGDSPQANIGLHFDQCCAFIDRAPTVIHCLLGVSRSPTIVASYLVWKHGMSAEEAMKLIKQKRPCISPNFGFLSQLKDWERELQP